MSKSQSLIIITLVGLVFCLVQCFPFSSYPGARTLTFEAHSYNDPRWSPDGNKILYNIWEGPGQLYIMNSDGSNATRVGESRLDYGLGDWSPDGRQLVFSASNRQDVPQLYVMDLEIGTIKQILASPQAAVRAEWSPNGKRIAVSLGEYKDLDSTQLYILNIDDGSLVPLTQLPLGGVVNFAWSPDGAQIAFEASDIVAGKGGASKSRVGPHLYLVNADGSHLRQIVGGFDGIYNPTWSPDGQKILFSYMGYAMQGGFYVVNPDGSGRKLIYPQPSCEDPHWSKSTNRLVFVCGRLGNRGQIYTMDMKDILKLQ